MTALWQNDGVEWQLLPSVGFDDEAALHTLVEEAPQMLPLSGSPQLVVVGREVQLGTGYADLLAIEASGRPAVIEVKLARNAEARRAVVAQALAYAAYLNELDASTFENDIIGGHLRNRGWSTLESAVAEADQEGSFDPAAFREGLDAAFADGGFRIVFVLDEAPLELVRLVGYLETIGERLTIDLITVSAYEIAGSKVLVPQRVDPERAPRDAAGQPARARRAAASGESSPGADEFERAIDASLPEQQSDLRQLVAWAKKLEGEGLAKLSSFNGQNRQVLLPKLPQDGVGLVTLWNENGASIQFWRSVFERRAPAALARVEALVAPSEVRQGNTTREITAPLLVTLEEAYREARENRRSGFDWSLVRAAVEAIPAGNWTTYGDLAELGGTAAIAVGRFVANERNLEGAHRVLGADGRPRAEFHWPDPDDQRDVVEVLRAEGVPFSANGVAEPSARIRSDDLKRLLD